MISFVIVLFVIVHYLVCTRISSLAPSIDFPKEFKNWIHTGRFHNHNGFAVFYKDSLGDRIFGEEMNFLRLEKILQKPILLLIHGLPMFSLDYHTLYNEMQYNFHVVALDLLGSGLSDKPGDINYDFSTQADAVVAILNSVVNERRRIAAAHGIRLGNNSFSVHLISHDIGVSVAQEMLSRRELVVRPIDTDDDVMLPVIESCIFLNGGIFAEQIHHHQGKMMREMIQSSSFGPIVQLLTSAKGFSAAVRKLYGIHTQPSAEYIQLIWSSVQHKNGVYLFHATSNYISDRERNRDRLVTAMSSSKGFGVRLLHINGPGDPIAGAHMAQYLQDTMPGIVDVLLLGDKIGHFPLSESPNEVLKAVDDFFKVIYT
jgi:pimeloyl-ACP methyl ester carboxylesterase